jgi:putative colanic acid biosysnthesis UDP-glucose lipid carrier transferase
MTAHGPAITGANVLLKRWIDLLFSSVILLVTSPLLLIIALAVKHTSPGPVIFKQRRTGMLGKIFYIYKFRTMTVCEDGGCLQQAVEVDTRVTPFGKLLRRTSLDEFPQFINILQNYMSIVGPRPHAVSHDRQFQKIVENYWQRFQVKPGITGWAQINGGRGNADTPEKVKRIVDCDLHYIKHWTIWLDLKIIIKTIGEVLRGNNAY